MTKNNISFWADALERAIANNGALAVEYRLKFYKELNRLTTMRDKDTDRLYRKIDKEHDNIKNSLKKINDYNNLIKAYVLDSKFTDVNSTALIQEFLEEVKDREINT